MPGRAGMDVAESGVVAARDTLVSPRVSLELYPLSGSATHVRSLASIGSLSP